MTATAKELTELAEVTEKLTLAVELIMDDRRGDPERTLNAGEAARFLGVHRKTLLLYTRLGLVYYQIGKNYMFRREDLINFRERYRASADISASIAARLKAQPISPRIVDRPAATLSA